MSAEKHYSCRTQVSGSGEEKALFVPELTLPAYGGTFRLDARGVTARRDDAVAPVQITIGHARVLDNFGVPGGVTERVLHRDTLVVDDSRRSLS